jgi:hypothetical protein
MGLCMPTLYDYLCTGTDAYCLSWWPLFNTVLSVCRDLLPVTCVLGLMQLNLCINKCATCVQGLVQLGLGINHCATCVQGLVQLNMCINHCATCMERPVFDHSALVRGLVPAALAWPVFNPLCPLCVKAWYSYLLAVQMCLCLTHSSCSLCVKT